MKAQEFLQSKKELNALCAAVRACTLKGDDQACEALIFDAMAKYPHAPEPHNLIGIVLEKQGDHPMAMKHFRAAWALDPHYLPARQNLENFGTFFSSGTYAFDESDCPEKTYDDYTIERDARGIGHVIRRA